MINGLTKSTAAATGLLLLLTGCMAAPAQREAKAGLDPRRACIAQCNRDNNICQDQQSTRSGGNTSQVGNTSYGMGATCKAELENCMRRC